MSVELNDRLLFKQVFAGLQSSGGGTAPYASQQKNAYANPGDNWLYTRNNHTAKVIQFVRGQCGLKTEFVPILLKCG
jgi:hypothetical protein